MKKIFTVAAVCAAFALSCSKEMTYGPEAGIERISFTASSDSKTVLSGSSVLWEKKDTLSVFDRTGANCVFTTEGSGASATFAGDVHPSVEYTVLYPYSVSASIDGDIVRTSIPTDQTAVSGSFARGASLSAAKLSGASVEMKNVCAYAKFTLAPTTYNVTSVKLQSVSGEHLSGPVEIDMSGSVPVATAANGALSYVNLVPSSPISSGTYYLPVVPVKCEGGINLVFNTSTGKTFMKEGTSPAEFVRSQYLDLGSIDLSKLVVIEEEPDDPSADPKSAYAPYGVDFSKLQSLGHPRLFLTAADFAALKERVVTNPDPNDIAYKLHRTLIANADKTAASSELAIYEIVGGKRLLTQSRNALQRLFQCAYAYRMTGEEKYLTKARAELNNVCNPSVFPDWNNKKHFLDPSEMSMGVAIAYDWLYYDLTLEERTAAHAALVNNELTPFRKYTPSTTNNWNMVCCGGAIASAIAVYEKDKEVAAYDIDRAIKSNMTAADYYYNPNGNGLEGNGYWSYAMDYQISIINALETAFGTSCGLADLPGFKKTGPWRLFMTGPTGGFNFSDSGQDSLNPTPEFIWLAARLNMPELLVREWDYLDGTSYSSARMLPLMMCGLARYPFVATPASFPSEKIWTANDKAPIVLTRLGWKYDETDKFVGLKGSGAVNGHAHMDAGTFVYDAFGVRWACDSHMGDYNTYEHLLSGLFSYVQKSYRWELLQQSNYFHNTLSFTWSDGSVDKWHPTDHVVGSRGSVLNTFESDAEGYGGTVDLSCYYKDAASSVKRTAKIYGEELNIIDEIKALSSHSAPFEWRMLTECEVSVEDGYIALSKSGKTVYLYCKTSGNVTVAPVYGYEPQIVRPSTWIARDWETIYNNFKKYHVVKFSSEVAAGGTATFTTMISPVKPSETGSYPIGEKPDFNDPDSAKW